MTTPEVRNAGLFDGELLTVIDKNGDEVPVEQYRFNDSFVSLIAANDRQYDKYANTESDGQSTPDEEQDQ